MRLRKSLFATEKVSVSISEWIVIISSLVIVGVMFLEVLLRYVFKAPLYGTEEIATNMVLWLWFFGMAYATYCGFYIGSNFPIRKRSAQDIFALVKPIFCLIITLIFCYFSYQYCHWTVVKNLHSISLRFPLIYGVVAVFIGLVLTAVYLIREIVIKTRAIGHQDKRAIK